MKIGTTYLESIKWCNHKGIHISNIDDRETAFKIRNYINDALNRFRSIASVVINEPDKSDMYNILIYGEMSTTVILEIIDELKGYHIFEEQ